MFMKPFRLFAGAALLAGCMQADDPVADNWIEQQAERAKARLDECIATQCATLDLDGLHLADYSQLAGLTHVTVLMISYTDFDDLSHIAGMTGLTELHIGSTKVRDLSGLAGFQNLRLLHAQGLEVTDYAVLAALPRLNEMSVSVESTAQMAQVAAARGLRWLDMEGSRDFDLAPLAGHPGIEVLDLNESWNYEGLDALLSLPRLTTLSIEETVSDEDNATVEALETKGVEVIALPIMIVC